jgi:AcrR family transcriptional regulator
MAKRATATAATGEAGERPRRVRDPESTRARLLSEAGRLFAERGFDGVSMPAIAAAAGVSPGAIYKHFDGKAQLFFEVIRAAVEPTRAEAESAGGVAGLPAAVAAYAARPLGRVRQMALEMHHAAATHAPVRDLLRRSLDRDIGAMAEGLAAAQAAGQAEPGLDPQLLATAAMVFIMGQMHLETLAPHLVGDPAWQAFVQSRVAALLGLRDGGGGG